MPPLRDTLSRRSKTSCNRSYSPLLCRSRKSVSLSWRDGPLSANSIFTPTPPMQKQYGFLTVCKNREMRSFRESALSKVIPLTSGRDSAATAPMSTLFICSSSCVVNFTVNLLRRLIERLPLFGGETQQASTTGMLACCLTLKQARQQRDQCGANDDDAAARHELFHTQIGVGNRLDGGRRRVKKYLWSFFRTAPAGQVRL